MDTYEKKYNEALERAKELIAKWTGKNKDFYVEDYAYIFPELRESDDERNIDTIFNCLYQCCDTGFISGTQRDNALAWLEKQKELFESGRGLYYYDGEKTTYCGYPATEDNPYDFAMSQQKEQKPVQSAEEKEFIRTIKSIIADFIRDKKPEDVGFYQQIYDWLDGRHIEQKPVEYPAGFYVTFPDGKKYYTKEMRCNNMKIKVVEPKPVEWSEEDEKIRRNLMSLLANMRGDRITEETYQKYYPWLSALRPQWKPTEEQMKALNWARCLIFETYTDKHIATEPYHILGELYDQLKQLKHGTDRKD